jgi:hypothetical protein
MARAAANEIAGVLIPTSHFSVMPGLVPGIHVVTGLAGCRTSTLSAAVPDVIVLDPL